ncbi:MAG: diaminopimelate decarboxylase [Burkholderiaceae bacterium]
MTDLSGPFPRPLLQQLARRHGTPLWVYDADTIRARIAELRRFPAIRYAQKANANLHVLRLMRAEGVLVDAVSAGEIQRALAAGYDAKDPMTPGVVFTADVLTTEVLALVTAHDIPVNCGSVDMLHQLGSATAGRSPGHRVWLRINPGFGHGHSNKTNTGGEHSKHGIWHADLPAALAAVRRHGLRLVGLHMHIGSGVDYGHLSQVCDAMVALAARVDHPIEAISAGGGLSIPYRPGEPRIDTAHYHALWDAARRRIADARGHAIHLELEPGRFLVAESGVLLAEVRATKTMGSRFFALVDAGFNELARPAMYGAHHEISLIPADGSAADRPLRATTVAGPLCESGDVFTQAEGGVVLARELPEPRVGDLLAFHDAGAYGASMSSNYNSRPLAPELLVDGGRATVIRRRQTIEELLALER